jgi:hypothetical protein
MAFLTLKLTCLSEETLKRSLGQCPNDLCSLRGVGGCVCSKLMSGILLLAISDLRKVLYSVVFTALARVGYSLVVLFYQYNKHEIVISPFRILILYATLAHGLDRSGECVSWTLSCAASRPLLPLVSLDLDMNP